MAATNEPLPVQGARAGEPEAWHVLFRRYQLPLYVYVFELVRHEETSLDLVQETFVSAARHLSGLQDDRKFGSWLFSIAHQKCTQHWRKQKHSRHHVEELDDELSDDSDDPRDWLIRREQEEEFMRLLNELPLPQRSALLLHFVEEFSLEEIAAITGAPVGTVKSRLHHARRALRKRIKERT